MIWGIVILVAIVVVASWAAGGGFERNRPVPPRDTPKGVNPVNPMLTRDYGDRD